ncbi:MAG: tetratricopeptide repeat protein [Phycisphaerales bacterium]|nr:tetratricopeptide repeat protein [Phycisphaerales bacterium]
MTRLEQLRQLAAAMPDDPMAHYGVGLECIQLQDWPAAVAAFSQAIDVDPDYAVAYYHRARAEIGAGDSDTARQTLETGIAVAGKAGDLHAQGEMRELLATLE